MRQRFTSIITALSMIASFIFTAPIITSAYGGGDGTSEATAFEISTEAELRQLAQEVNGGNDYSGYFFKLTNNIELDCDHSNEKRWIPIGLDEDNWDEELQHPFNGTFDGNNFKISGMVISGLFNDNYNNSIEGIGLFGHIGINGVIKNVEIEATSINNILSVGSIAGVNEGTVDNCHTTASNNIYCHMFNEELNYGSQN